MVFGDSPVSCFWATHLMLSIRSLGRLIMCANIRGEKQRRIDFNIVLRRAQLKSKYILGMEIRTTKLN